MDSKASDEFMTTAQFKASLEQRGFRFQAEGTKLFVVLYCVVCGWREEKKAETLAEILGFELFS